MITFRFTRTAASALGIQLSDDPPPGTSPLGDWYVNLVPSVGGEAFIFMNEQSLLAVIVPRRERKVLQVCVARVANVLSMIGVSNERIEEELEHFLEVRAGKTISKRCLGVMNYLAARFQEAIGETTPGKPLSLSDFELKMANLPQPTLAYRSAKEMAFELLGTATRFGAM